MGLFRSSLLFLLAAVVITVDAHSCSSKTKKAHIDVISLAKVVEKFNVKEGRYPTTAEGLQILLEAKRESKGESQQGFIRYLPKDPWGNAYQYRFPGIHNPDSFDLWTHGSDGLPGGDGVQADCGNWHEECYPKPEKPFTIVWGVLALLLSPLVWLPAYLVLTAYRKYQGKSISEAAKGWHLWLMLASFPVFCFLVYWTFGINTIC